MGNRVVDPLPPEAAARASAHLTVVDHGAGDLVLAVGGVVEAAHFPVSGLFTTGAPTTEGDLVELVGAGADGVLGLGDALGGGPTARPVTCQVSGRTLRISAPALRELMVDNSAFAGLLDAYNQAVSTHLGQRVVCLHHHDAVQRCATWVLQAGDRLGDEDVPLTQVFLARALGLRRSTVSVTAARLRATDTITYRYGKVSITDRPVLWAAACQCYPSSTTPTRGPVAARSPRRLAAAAGRTGAHH